MGFVKGILAAGVASAAIAFAAGSASAATFIDNMGTLDAFSSVSGSVTLVDVAPTTRKAGSLTYSFGPTSVQPAFKATVPSSNGALNLAFEFSLSQALTLVNADAINPLAGGHALGGAPQIYVTDSIGGAPLPGLGPDAFTFDATLNSLAVATGTVTLNPGTYYEYIVGNAVPGTTKVNVGAFAGAAVPEPAVWGSMLLGFGAIGGALRSRRRAAAAVA